MSSVEKEIRHFIIESLLYGETDTELSSEDSLLEKGVVDSTGVLELVAFLETKYGIEVKENELVPANLDSVNKLVDFVGRKTATVR